MDINPKQQRSTLVDEHSKNFSRRSPRKKGTSDKPPHLAAGTIPQCAGALSSRTTPVTAVSPRALLKV